MAGGRAGRLPIEQGERFASLRRGVCSLGLWEWVLGSGIRVSTSQCCCREL